MDLDSLGYGPDLHESFAALSRPDLAPARVIAHLGAHLVIAGAPPAVRAELAGRLRHELATDERPTVGDWVAVAPAGELAIVHRVLPRRTVLIRRAAGKRVSETQVVAANVDTFFVVTSANRDANPRRLERYLAAIADGGAAAVIVANKTDLATADQLAELGARLGEVGRGAPVAMVSAATGDGFDAITGLLRPGCTFALIGMSGVGKSSLINRLLGDERIPVLPIDADDRGRHATTHRELFALPGGALVIDTPGMRSFGLPDDDGGIAAEFADLVEVAGSCRFGDCQHAGEPGCAVEAAIDDGSLPADRLAGYRKLLREVAALERRLDPVQRERTKQRWKSIHVAQRARSKHDPKRS